MQHSTSYTNVLFRQMEKYKISATRS